jgi:hypothetical protein
MAASTFARIAGALFGVLALAHAARLFYAVPVTVGGDAVPMAVSWFGIVLAGALCVLGLTARR